MPIKKGEIMKKLLSVILTVAIAMTLAVSASAASLYDVLFNVNAGEDVSNYCYENHLVGTVIPDQLKIEFDLTVTDTINPYATIFCFHKGDGNARLCFTLGGGLFYNDWSGNWFDAGLHNGVYDNIFGDYIGETVHVSIVVDYEYFSVYVNDEYAYGSDTLADRNSDSDAFYGSGTMTDFWGISSFVCTASKLDFGYNSWWVSESLDCVNAEIADFSIYFDDNLMAKYFVGGEAGVNELHDESEYAPETEAPETEAPETEAPETEAPEETTAAPETEAPVDEGGCGSSLAAASAIVVITAVLGYAIVKKH